jgi:hypothetical protein
MVGLLEKLIDLVQAVLLMPDNLAKALLLAWVLTLSVFSYLQGRELNEMHLQLTVDQAKHATERDSDLKRLEHFVALAEQINARLVQDALDRKK